MVFAQAAKPVLLSKSCSLGGFINSKRNRTHYYLFGFKNVLTLILLEGIIRIVPT